MEINILNKTVEYYFYKDSITINKDTIDYIEYYVKRLYTEGNITQIENQKEYYGQWKIKE